jgi:hypothetical protein
MNGIYKEFASVPGPELNHSLEVVPRPGLLVLTRLTKKQERSGQARAQIIMIVTVFAVMYFYRNRKLANFDFILPQPIFRSSWKC